MSTIYRFFRSWPALFALVAGFASAAEPAKPPGSFPPEAYASLGSNFARHNKLTELGWSDVQIEAFLRGMREAFAGKSRAFDAQAAALQDEVLARLERIGAGEKMPPAEFFADPARLDDYMKQVSKRFQLERMDSGLGFGMAARGGGSRPAPEDTVVLSCQVAAADAKSALPQLAMDRRRVKVSDLLPGLAEGIQMMTPDSQAMIVLPPDLSFGDGEWPAGVDRGTPLIYVVSLHEVIVAP
ncbi:MAG TPA: FKBP-type peptidyl-prolyl cis-trans isomerase [Lacunisphaera sp.]|nr:FKBP-type peptidyl-prolyl cis-trans isomerase [Lacunisphaera sp.]